MMKDNHSERQLQHFGRALHSQIEDTLTCDQCQMLLPDYLHAENEIGERIGEETRFVAVRNHLSLCPYCTMAHLQMSEWLIASFSDSIPSAAAYPTFDLSFLQPQSSSPSPTPWPLELLQKSRQQGQQWLHDVAGGLYLFFTSTPSLAGAGWAVKSGEEVTLLARTVLGEEDLPYWEIEAAVFATDADQCRIEVALYAFEPLDGELADIGVTLNDGASERFALSDAHGLVEFDAIRRDQIGSIIIRVALPAANQS